MSEEWWLQPALIEWSRVLLDSFRHWTGRDLVEPKGTAEEQAGALFTAPFVVVSHGTEADPILNYGNRAALDLWEMAWAEFRRTPSRLTTEPVNQAERARMLAESAARGYCSGYRGVRISRSGRRFLVDEATVWTLIDREGRQRGQGATFSRWTFL